DRFKGSILGFQFPGVLLIGPAMSPPVGAFLPIPTDEQIACANPWAYLSGTVGPGEQTFSLSGAPDPLPAGTGPSKATMFDGLLAQRGGGAKGLYREGLRFPHQRYEGGKPVEDGDSVMPEPFSHERAEGQERDGPLDQGIYGIYKIA